MKSKKPLLIVILLFMAAILFQEAIHEAKLKNVASRVVFEIDVELASLKSELSILKAVNEATKVQLSYCNDATDWYRKMAAQCVHKKIEVKNNATH